MSRASHLPHTAPSARITRRTASATPSVPLRSRDMTGDTGSSRRIPAIRVDQWLPEWDDVLFDAAAFRSAPPKHFFLFSMPAGELRALSGIFRRTTKSGVARSADLGIQRRHDPERSDEIHEFVRHGFPWSSLTAQRQASGEFDDLKKPGWLPTAIVVNILRPDDTREGRSLASKDAIRVPTRPQPVTELVLPAGFAGESFRPTQLAPIEVIDGQHRLWAFENDKNLLTYQLPVVAFYGLDRSWQAYLFYTINIKPKKINPSLAYDLYPLLRTEDWLDRFEGHTVYRETRAQEITEAVWSYPDSPWRDRINMLGERGRSTVTQAAWIRSLIATFIKSSEGPGVRSGGLFGAPVGANRLTLGWTRAQQAAFIIAIWQELQHAVAAASLDWADELRGGGEPRVPDPAFEGRFTLLNTDQGVRGILAIFNDLARESALSLALSSWEVSGPTDGTGETPIREALRSLKSHRIFRFVKRLAECLASYDWRTSGAPGLSEVHKSNKSRFRGSTGYRELRKDLLYHIVECNDIEGPLAADLVHKLGL